jgi:hypothetical protein
MYVGGCKDVLAGSTKLNGNMPHAARLPRIGQPFCKQYVFTQRNKKKTKYINTPSRDIKPEYCFQGAKFQEPIPEGTPFLCNTTPGSPGARSPTRPATVHKLRPGDIDVVGAMGDSITAGNGTRRSI